MNDVHFEIVRLLLTDARMPFSTIAKKLKVSTDTISRTYKNLINDGIIQRSSITVDLKKFGYNVGVLILLNIDSGFDSNDIFEELTKIQNLFVIAKTVGDSDFTLHAFARDFKDFKECLNKIGEIKGIKEIEYLIFPRTDLNMPYKRYYNRALLGIFEK